MHKYFNCKAVEVMKLKSMAARIIDGYDDLKNITGQVLNNTSKNCINL